MIIKLPFFLLLNIHVISLLLDIYGRIFIYKIIDKVRQSGYLNSNRNLQLFGLYYKNSTRFIQKIKILYYAKKKS